MSENTLESKKLSANDAIERMIKMVNYNQTADFYKIAEIYQNNFVNGSATYWKIKNALMRRPRELKSLDDLSDKMKKLISTSDPSIENTFLNSDTKLLINELLLEWKNIAVFNYHNLKVRNKILLHGPTGNGKTTIAKYIAKQTGLPYLEVKSDEVIDSHLGSTGSNIYNIFNSIHEPCVVFWDEIDSIGCKRGTSQQAAGHENDRMTNSLLVNMEKMHPEVVFIGATNRKDSLDSAFLRRFDLKFEVCAPNTIEKFHFAQQMIDFYKLPIEMIDLKEFSSYSEIKDQFTAIARTFVLNKIRTNEKEPS